MRILELLKQSDKPLKQCEIGRIIGLDRKSVWRNVAKLREGGFIIQQDEHGYYLPKPKTEGILSQEDIRVIINRLELNSGITEEQRNKLREKIQDVNRTICAPLFRRK